MTTTINKEEIQKFSKLADEWWDVNGKFKPLHMFNPIRIEYILAEVSNYFKIDREEKLVDQQLWFETLLINNQVTLFGSNFPSSTIIGLRLLPLLSHSSMHTRA